MGHHLRPPRKPKHRGRAEPEWKSADYSPSTVRSVSSGQRRGQTVSRKKVNPKDRNQKGNGTELCIQSEEEWLECGENLEIVSSPRSRVCIPLGIDVRRQSRHYGSAFATQRVDRGVHFWKIRVFCGDAGDGGDPSGFGVGFLPNSSRCNRGSANPRNGWFLGVLSRNGSVGISGDCGVWCDGNKVS